MRKQLLFLVVLFFTTLISQAANWYVDPLGTDDITHGSGTGINAFKTIQYAIGYGAVTAGDVINVAAGTYVESNILVDKSLTIQGTGATRDAVVIVPTGTDPNEDNAFGAGALNGFIIKAHAVTIRKLTINGNPAGTPGVFNFRAGIVSDDASGAWNNLHVNNVAIKYTYRRGISIFPRTVSGTVIENSSVEYVAYNQGMYLAGHSLALNNTVRHCFQGIVQNPDASTPTGLFKMNGNILSEIGNFSGCYNYPNGQPRAIQFDAGDPTFRTVEIKNNVISDAGSIGPIGTVGIYTRRANAASIVENNAITLTSGGSYSGGTQSVGLLLGWSYARGFTARLNHVNTTGAGIGIMLNGVGTSASPMILEGNVLTSTSSSHAGKGDGTGIYIANQFLYNVADKFESFVKILNHNSITGFVRGIEAEKIVTSSFPLTVVAHNNAIAGNIIGIEASTMSSPIDATNNYWGGDGPNDAALYPSATGSGVSAKVSFTPWWCDALMGTHCPALIPGMSILNTTTGAQFPPTGLFNAFISAGDGETIYLAGPVDGQPYVFAGRTLYIVGPGSIDMHNGTSVFTMNAGNLIIDGIQFINPGTAPTIGVYGGSLKLRNCTIMCPSPAFPGLSIYSGLVDAGTLNDPGHNLFIGNSPQVAIENNLPVGQYAIGNNWGSLSGPAVISNPSGTGAAITGAGVDSVYYAPFAGGPVTTVASVDICTGVTSVDIPVTVTNFSNVGSIALTFGFTPAQLTNPQIVYTNPAFTPWGPFTVTDDLGLIAAGTFKVSGFGALPANGVILAPGSILFTLRFDILPNLGTNSTAPVFLNENPQGIACEYGGVAPLYHPFIDIPTSTYYLNGGVTIKQCQKISGIFTYYNNANTVLTSQDITVKLYKSSDVSHSTVIGTTVTNGSGYYEFAGMFADTYDIIATSTHTTDGSVNTTDAAQVNYYPIAPTFIEKVRFYAGDVGTLSPYVEQDWFLSSTDAQRIQQNFVNGKAFDRPWTFWRTGQFINDNPIVAVESFPSVVLSAGSDATANMYGLCTGDFNRSFNPLLKKSPSTTLDLVYGRSVLVTDNQEFDLPVRIVHASSIGALSLILNFPPDLVEIKDVLVNGTGGRLDWAVTGNELRIGWNSLVAADLAAYDNLITLRMKTTDAFTKWATIRLSLAADPLNELANGRYDVIPDAVLSVDVVDASPNGIGEQSAANAISIRNFPNPAASMTTFAYTLPFNGNVILEIRNTFGETVKILANEVQAAGNHSLNFDATGLASGVYTATIKLNSKTNAVKSTIKLIISR